MGHAAREVGEAMSREQIEALRRLADDASWILLSDDEWRDRDSIVASNPDHNYRTKAAVTFRRFFDACEPRVILGLLSALDAELAKYVADAERWRTLIPHLKSWPSGGGGTHLEAWLPGLCSPREDVTKIVDRLARAARTATCEEGR